MITEVNKHFTPLHLSYPVTTVPQKYGKAHNSYLSKRKIHTAKAFCHTATSIKKNEKRLLPFFSKAVVVRVQ